MKIQASNPSAITETTRATPSRTESAGMGGAKRTLQADVISLTPIAQNTLEGDKTKVAAMKAIVNAPGYSPDMSALAKKLIAGAIEAGK